MEKLHMVFEFKGALSTDVKKFIVKKFIAFALGVLAFALLAAFPLMSLIARALTWGYPIAVYGFLVVFIPFCLWLAARSALKTEAQAHIYYDGYDFVSKIQMKIMLVEQPIEIGIERVKQVVDYGDWYDIRLGAFKWALFIVCQKDLLTQGTLEEFEALFEDRIVRKLPKNT